MSTTQGCCVDRAHYERTGQGSLGCTESTCMELPDGATCADCVHTARCTGIFGAKAGDTTCQFFPRRFKARKEAADAA